jgi:predicted amidohydrolase
MTGPGARRVAALQLNSQDDVGANLEACRALVAKAAQNGAELALLPENFAFFGADEGRYAVAERLGDADAPIQCALASMARASKLAIIGGGMPIQSDDARRPYNALVAFGSDGRFLASYRKIHLFDVALADGTVLSESKGTTPGDDAVVVDVGDLRLGLSICYDLRFPELYRRLVDARADVLLVPAAFTVHTGKDHWHVLLRARAIESQSWVVAAAQWGKHPRARTTYGHSMIVDPWGTIVAEASDGVGLIVADIDPEYSAKVRASLPSLQHRRL